MTSLTDADITQRTRAFIERSFLYGHRGAALSDHDPLISKGIVDSMGAIELARFLEREFAITIGDNEITEANLRSLADIARFVASKRAPR